MYFPHIMKTLIRSLLPFIVAFGITYNASASDASPDTSDASPDTAKAVVQASNAPLQANFATAFFPQNILYDMTFGKGAMLRPELCVSQDPFSFTVWNNYDISGKQNTETDFLLKYSSAISSINVTLGAAYYEFPNSAVRDCQEIFIDAALPSFVDLSFHAGKAFGEDSGKGMLARLAASKTLDFTTLHKYLSGISTSVEASAIYNENYFSKGNGLSSLALSAAVKKSWKDSYVAGVYTRQFGMSGRDKSLVNNMRYFALSAGVNL
jgi:hypothetical protein